MSRSRSFALVVAAALTAALAPATLASAAAPADNARAEHDRIVAYWTPERMKAAKPRDFVRQKDGSFALAPTPRAGKATGGTTTVISSTTGASWTKGGEVLNRTGKVYFTLGASRYQCSGSVASDGLEGGKSIVLTAAHCVFDNETGVWATNWIFIPAFDVNPDTTIAGCTAERTTFGCWTAQRLVAHSGFTGESTYSTTATTHDFAFAVVGDGGKADGSLDGVVGSYPLAINLTTSQAQRMSAFGYPAAGRYNGLDLTYCSGSVIKDPYNAYSSTDDPWGMSCGMTGGSSGGPWLVSQTASDLSSLTLDAAGNGGSLGSLNSYGYSGVRYMFGPVFDAKAKAVWDAASVLSKDGALPTGLVVSDLAP
jgi:hypothetical protein